MPGGFAVDSDEKLLDMARKGSEESLAALLSRYEGDIRARALPIRVSGVETEDLIQEGKIGFLSAVGKYDPSRNASFRTYALRCISSKIFSAVRSASRKKHLPLNGYVSLDDVRDTGEMISSQVVNPEDMIVSRESARFLWAQVTNDFEPLERKILFYYLSGFSYAAIAKRLGATPKAIDNALQRIKRKLSLKMAG